MGRHSKCGTAVCGWRRHLPLTTTALPRTQPQPHGSPLFVDCAQLLTASYALLECAHAENLSARYAFASDCAAAYSITSFCSTRCCSSLQSNGNVSSFQSNILSFAYHRRKHKLVLQVQVTLSVGETSLSLLTLEICIYKEDLLECNK
jgi:hypothetical protein